MISNRHIRAEYNQWVEWEYKNVSTLCGRKTPAHNTGIPGITEQDSIVEVKGKKYFGWCHACCRIAYDELKNVEDVEMDSAVKELYCRMSEVISPIAIVLIDRERARREREKALRQN